jgi:hypothetical protein
VIRADVDGGVGVTQHLFQASKTLIVLQMAQDRELVWLEEVPVADWNQIVIEDMQHELLESRRIWKVASRL